MSKQIREGYKMTELGEIPVEWEIKKISDICEINPESLGNGTDENLLINYIDIESVSTGKISTVKEFLFKEAPSRARRIVKKDDVIVSTVRPYLKAFAKIKENKDNLVCSTGFAVLRCKEQSNPEFVFQYTLSDSFLNQLINKMVGSNYPAVNASDIKDTLAILPPFNEQQKIASILSTIDEHIEQVDGLIEKTKELKKGLMQKLLTKGIGHTEFKMTEIGMIPKEWEVKSLEEISIGKGEYGINAAAKEYEQNEPRYLRITDIDDNYKLSNHEIKSVEANEDEYKKYILKENDIVFARTGNTTGKSYLYEKCDGELVFAGFLIKFTINPLLYDSSFLKYYVQTKYYWDWVQKMSLRSGQPGINSKEYSSLLVPAPPVDEQYKIATILREVDNRIEKYDIKRQKLQHLKKGLMQKLLTGKLRVC